MDHKNYFMYVLLCEDGSFYGGFTDDVVRRFHKHVEGKGAKYTAKHRPLRILYFHSFPSKSQALKAEYAFKHQPRREKEEFLLDRGIHAFNWKL